MATPTTGVVEEAGVGESDTSAHAWQCPTCSARRGRQLCLMHA